MAKSNVPQLRVGTTGRQGASGRNAPRPATTSVGQEQRNREMVEGARRHSGAEPMPAEPRTARAGQQPRPAATAASRAAGGPARGNASVPVKPGTPASAAAAATTTTAARTGTTSQMRGAPRRAPVQLPLGRVQQGSSGGRPSAAQNPSNRRTVRVTGGASGQIRGIRVEALQTGFYDNERKRPGDVFTIRSMEEFSDGENDRYVEEEVDNGRGGKRTVRRRLPRGWMRLVDSSTPERTTTPNEAIRQQHDEILAGRVAERSAGRVPALRVGTVAPPPGAARATGDADVLGDDLEGADDFPE